MRNTRSFFIGPLPIGGGAPVTVQSMLNVKFGRWKNITPQAADIALGYYGRTPAPVDPEVQKLCAEKTG